MARITDVNEIHRLYLKAKNKEFAESTRKRASAELAKINESVCVWENQRYVNGCVRASLCREMGQDLPN